MSKLKTAIGNEIEECPILYKATYWMLLVYALIWCGLAVSITGCSS